MLMNPETFLQAAPGWFFENVFITILIALTFIVIILTFLYMTFTKEEETKAS
jgi:heme/copper-type cytochrome/quinol oxidase subunit 2